MSEIHIDGVPKGQDGPGTPRRSCASSSMSSILYFEMFSNGVFYLLRMTYMRLAVCSLLTTFVMVRSLSSGTFSQALNAASICPRISLPGIELMCEKGSSKA